MSMFKYLSLVSYTWRKDSEEIVLKWTVSKNCEFLLPPPFDVDDEEEEEEDRSSYV
jgi:hypothetical protein